MNKLTILLVEDDIQACKEITNYVNGFDDVELVSVTNNSAKAVEDIAYYLPNAVILDLELHQGSGSGLDVLRKLKEMPLEIYPYVLVTTNNSSQITYEYARQLGADYILSKHQSDYTNKTPIDFLRMMINIILSKSKAAAKNTVQSGVSPNVRTKNTRRKIISELNEVGINPKAVGYQYLVDAIELVAEGTRQNLCCVIGQKYGKTDSSVERAMQNAICRAWRQNDAETLYTVYTAKINSERGVPTITEFVCFYANKIKNEMI